MSISTDTTPSDVDSSQPPVDKAPSRARSKKATTGVRHSVELTLKISAMNEAQRSLLASATGSNSTAVVDLAVDTLNRETDARAVLTALSDICRADPMEAGILATVLASENKALFKAAWKILVLLPSDLTAAQIPAASASAGLAFAKAAKSLDEPSRKAVSRLLKDLGE